MTAQQHWEAMDPRARYDIKVIVQQLGADPDDESQLWHAMGALAIAARLGQLWLAEQSGR